MAPEYIDDGVITIKSDIYSLGVIIRHMVKGRNSGDTTDEDVCRRRKNIYKFLFCINI